MSFHDNYVTSPGRIFSANILVWQDKVLLWVKLVEHENGRHIDKHHVLIMCIKCWACGCTK